MRYLYQIGVALYGRAIGLAALFLPKAKLWIDGRRNWRTSFQQLKKADHYIWFHTASLGEFESAKPIIQAVRRAYPEKKIWLTFFSPSGYELRKNDSIADVITYLPLDSPQTARDFLAIIQPELAVFIRYEFWLFYLKELNRKEVPLIIASATFREGQFLLKPYGAFLKKYAQRIHAILVQDAGSLQLLQQHGFQNALLAGDTRVDRVVSISATAESFPIIETFKNAQHLFIAGSCWGPDEEVFLQTVLHQHNTKIILAPHEVHESNLLRIEKSLDQNYVRWSQLNSTNATSVKVIIIDNIGLLAQLYQYADSAFIGGGFTTGIHNLLEATVYGCPVFFGPKHQSFPEGKGLIKAGGGFCITSSETFTKQWKSLISQADNLEKARAAAKKYTLNRSGATEKTMKTIRELLN